MGHWTAGKGRAPVKHMSSGEYGAYVSDFASHTLSHYTGGAGGKFSYTPSYSTTYQGSRKRVLRRQSAKIVWDSRTNTARSETKLNEVVGKFGLDVLQKIFLHALVIAYPPAAILTVAIAAFQIAKIIIRTRQVYKDYQHGRLSKHKVVQLVQDVSAFVAGSPMESGTNTLVMDSVKGSLVNNTVFIELASDTISSAGTQLVSTGAGVVAGGVFDLFGSPHVT